MGQRTTSFSIVEYGELNGPFRYDFFPKRPLAPGMNTKLIVTFKCTSMEDIFEVIALIDQDNNPVYVLVCAKNPPPILRCEYIYTRIENSGCCVFCELIFLTTPTQQTRVSDACEAASPPLQLGRITPNEL